MKKGLFLAATMVISGIAFNVLAEPYSFVMKVADYAAHFPPTAPAEGNELTFDESGTRIFNAFGEYKIRVPSPTAVTVKAWGAGGGGIEGGVGGYTQGSLVLQPNQTYIIWVGQGGISGGQDGTGYEDRFGGGGLAGATNSTSRNQGTGGGLSGVFLGEVVQQNALLIAGGGGGACFGNGQPMGKALGGNGGGLTGGNGYYAYSGTPGLGGTQTVGGAAGNDSYFAGNTPGEGLRGGWGAGSITERYSGGGGGGGYYGGGGGGGNNYCGPPGGGGSSYVDSNMVTSAQMLRLQNQGGPVPNAGDEHYGDAAGIPTGVYPDISAPSGRVVILRESQEAI